MVLMTVDISPFKELYPFKSNWFNIDDLKLHYLDEGSQDAPVLVMVHGNPTWSFYYRTLISPLKENYRIIVPDHIGCGLSDKPQDYGYTIEQHIENLDALITHLGLKNIRLVVHDWGGAIGIGYAVRHPENITGFIVFNTAAFMFPIPWNIRICRPKRSGGFIVRRLNAFARLALRFGTSQRKRFTKAVRAGYLAPYNNWNNRIVIHRFVQEIPIELNHPTRTLMNELVEGLAQFRQHPMIIIWGADDFVFSERNVLPEWKSRFPDAKIHVLKKAGHYVVEDAHEQILPLVKDFLKTL